MNVSPVVEMNIHIIIFVAHYISKGILQLLRKNELEKAHKMSKVTKRPGQPWRGLVGDRELFCSVLAYCCTLLSLVILFCFNLAQSCGSASSSVPTGTALSFQDFRLDVDSKYLLHVLMMYSRVSSTYECR